MASIDYAILFFGRVFPTVASKHKLQIINHFSECLAPKNAKPGPRFCALQMNVLGAICFAMKCIGENKTGRIEGDQLKQSCAEIALPFLSTDNIVLKCLAIETLCRISQAVAEPHVIIFSCDSYFFLQNLSFSVCRCECSVLFQQSSYVVGRTVKNGLCTFFGLPPLLCWISWRRSAPQHVCLHASNAGSRQQFSVCASMVNTLAIACGLFRRGHVPSICRTMSEPVHEIVAEHSKFTC